MTLNEYQEAAGKTAIYPEAGQGTKMALAYCALGLGEAGEIQNKIKKVLREDPGIKGMKNIVLAEELGDLLWYISQLASEIDYSLHEVACLNLAKLQDRQERGVLKGSGDDR